MMPSLMKKAKGKLSKLGKMLKGKKMSSLKRLKGKKMSPLKSKRRIMLGAIKDKVVGGMLKKLVALRKKMDELKKSNCRVRCWFKKAQIALSMRSILKKLVQMKDKVLKMILDKINAMEKCTGMCAKAKALIEK